MNRYGLTIIPWPFLFRPLQDEPVSWLGHVHADHLLPLLLHNAGLVCLQVPSLVGGGGGGNVVIKKCM